MPASLEHQERMLRHHPRMREALIAASHALKSYAYGNSSPDLALDIAIKVDAVLSDVERDAA